MVEKHESITIIKDCVIRALWQKVPEEFSGYRIELSYKEKAEDLFAKTFQVDIDQRKFIEEIPTWNPKTKERLYFTDGMTDIDFFIQQGDFSIIWSPSSGRDILLSLRKGEFEKMVSWINIQNKKK